MGCSPRIETVTFTVDESGSELLVCPLTIEVCNCDRIKIVADGCDLEIKGLKKVVGIDPIRLNRDIAILSVKDSVGKDGEYQYKPEDLDTGSTPPTAGPPTVRIKERN